MAFAAGERATAARINRLQPTSYDAVATSALAGPVTSADVPGCTVTLTTQTATAVAVVQAVWDADFTGVTATLASGTLVVDGTAQGRFGIFQQGPGTASDRATVAQIFRVALGAAGSHTLKLVATAPTGITINVYTSMIVTIYEVV